MATTDVMSIDGKPVSHAKERIDNFIASERPEILIPSTLYTELLMISSIEQIDLDYYLYANDAFVLVNYDFRAAAELCGIEKPTNGKRLSRNDTMAKIRFDRQILAVAKLHQVDLVFSTDVGFHTDAVRYGQTPRCISSLPLPPTLIQPQLELVHKSEINK